MAENDCKESGEDEDRLPTFHRTIKLPPELWDIRSSVFKANGRIRTDNPWFTKPELCR